MINITGRRRLHLPKGILFFAALAMGEALCVAHAPAASASKTFSGNWKYQQTCGFQHSATLALSQTGDDVAGDWSDGTRLSGSDGSLKGSVRDGKLFVRYCGTDESSGYATCPSYEAKESDYFVRSGGDLVWYQANGEGAGELLTGMSCFIR